jgi:hypothetical protein
MKRLRRALGAPFRWLWRVRGRVLCLMRFHQVKVDAVSARGASWQVMIGYCARPRCTYVEDAMAMRKTV